MSAPKRGLGKGLAALLGNTPVPTAAGAEMLREIPVAQITPNPFQPRKTFDQTALDELKLSIAEYGVLIPIIVRRRGDGYELVAGERRWRASAALARPTIPAIVRQSDDRETLEIAIIENLQRQNLNALEEAAGFQSLIDEHGFTQDDVARRLGKSRPAIANTLRLLALPDAVKAMIVDGRISAGHARAVLAAPAEGRVELARRIVEEGLTVRAAEQLAAQASQPRDARPPARTAPVGASPEELDFEARMRERYGTHVALVRSGKGGRIELRFADDDELMRIGDLLLGG